MTHACPQGNAEASGDRQLAQESYMKSRQRVRNRPAPIQRRARTPAPVSPANTKTATPEPARVSTKIHFAEVLLSAPRADLRGARSARIDLVLGLQRTQGNHAVQQIIRRLQTIP